MSERRRDARVQMDRPIKVHCPETGRYLQGRTDNVSAGGAMLEIRHPSLLVAGQVLRVGIAWTRQQAVIPAATLLDAVVVRSAALGDRQQVAVAFAHRQELARTA